MWHVDGDKRIQGGVMAVALLAIPGAYAEEHRIPAGAELTTEAATAVPSVTEMTEDPRITPGESQRPMMFTGNNFAGLFEKLQGDRVVLKESVSGCPVLVSPADDGDWTVEDFGADFVTLGKADGSGTRTYPIGRLCLWSATDD